MLLPLELLPTLGRRKFGYQLELHYLPAIQDLAVEVPTVRNVDKDTHPLHVPPLLMSLPERKSCIRLEGATSAYGKIPQQGLPLVLQLQGVSEETPHQHLFLTELGSRKAEPFCLTRVKNYTLR